MVAEDEFQRHPPGFPDPFVVGVDLHSLRDPGGAGRLMVSHSFYLHDTDVAGGIGFQAVVVTHGGDEYPVPAGDIHDGLTGSAGDRDAIEFDVIDDVGHTLTLS